MFTQNISQNNSVQGILTFKTTMCVESNSFFFNKSLLMVAIVAKYFQCVTRLIFNLFGFKVLFQAYTERNIVSSPRKKMGGGGVKILLTGEGFLNFDGGRRADDGRSNIKHGGGVTIWNSLNGCE